MKHKIFTGKVLTIALSLTLGLLFISCDNDDEQMSGKSAITLSETGDPTMNSITVTVTPNGYTANYSYAIGTSDQREQFEQGTLTGIRNVNGNEATEHTFTSLTPETTYTVFARGINADGEAGATATLIVATAPESVADPNATVTVELVGDPTGRTITAKFTPGGDAVRVYYAIGTADDYESFADGTMRGIGRGNAEEEFTNKFQNLNCAVEYTIFAKAEDSKGDMGAIATVTATTLEPSVTANILYVDTVLATVETVIGEATSFYQVIVTSERSLDGFDLKEWMLTFGAEVYNKTTTINWKLDGYTGANNFIGILIYDENETLYSYYEEEFLAPAFDPNAGAAGASIAIDEVTSTTLKYTVTKTTPDTYCFYDYLVTKEFYDTYAYSWFSYLHLIAYPSYENYSASWTDLTPETDYVIIVTPFNVNGREGFTDIVTTEFTTPAGAASSAKGAIPSSQTVRAKMGSVINIP